MYDDFMKGFESATALIMRYADDNPDDLQDYIEMLLQTLKEKRTV